MERSDVTFPSGDAHCAAWLYRPTNAPAATAPAACVVMAHGFSLTRHDGLTPYAERLAEAGIAALAFDHRYLGDSGGEPRQRFRKRDHFGAFLGDGPRRVADDQVEFLSRQGLLAG